MRVTIAEVAQRAQVSKATVSRVLNGKPDVDASTAQRVRKVIDEIGYVPSARAVGLARGRTRTVGMLAPSLTWPWMGEVLQGIVDTLEADGYGLLLYTINRGPESLNQFANHVSANAFDGLLVVEPPDTLHYISTLYRAGLPVVMIDDRGSHPEFPSVTTTNRQGGADVARHLVAAGRRRFAVVTGPPHFGCTQARLDGFRLALAEAGLTLHPDLIVDGDFTPTFTNVLLQKDFDLGLAAAKELGVVMPLASVTRNLVAQEVGNGNVDQDFASLILTIAHGSGLDIASENAEVTDGLGDS